MTASTICPGDRRDGGESVNGLTHEDHSGLSIFGNLCQELHGPGSSVALGRKRVERFLLIIKKSKPVVREKMCDILIFVAAVVAMESFGRRTRMQRAPSLQQSQRNGTYAASNGRVQEESLPPFVLTR